MSWLDQVESFLYAIYAALVGAVVVLIRKVLINEKQIDVLKKELEDIHEYRKERDALINDQLSEIRIDIKNLLTRE